MLRATSKWRLLALIAPLAAIVAAAAFFLSSSLSTPERVLGIGDIDLTGITCADIYRDPEGDTAKGSAPDDDDFLVGMTMSRIEPVQPPEANKWSIKSVQYLGPDLEVGDEDPADDLVPDKNSGIESCAEARDSGRAGAENGEMNPHQGAFQNQGGDRPGAIATYNPTTKELTYSTCVLLGAWWTRTDVNIVINQTGPNAVNYGIATLYIPTSSPAAEDPPGVAVDPSTCLDLGPTGTYSYPSVLASHSRDATTDHTDLAKNIAASIEEDPDGPHPKAKDVRQDHDGTAESPTFLADDWDGDGCPDWDELDKDFVNGIDPFNPYDCDRNFDSTFHITVEAERNTTKCDLLDLVLGTCIGNGSYYQCVADISHAKTPAQGDQESLSTVLSCSTNNAAVVVNPVDAGADTCPPADPEYCGNGVPSYYPNQVPPPYAAIEPGTDHTVLSGAGNYYDPTTNEIHVEGCFENVAGIIGPNVFVRGVIDAETSQGTIDIWVARADCADPGGEPPTFPASGVTVTEVQSKHPRKAPDDPELPIELHFDTDGDWCSDTAELGNDEAAGGHRDPANQWDYMNPTQDGLNRVDDILAVVNQYFDDDNDANPGEPPYVAGYNVDTDRTSIVGANPWNLGPPNGQQRVDDILAAVKSYFHDCGPNHVGS